MKIFIVLSISLVLIFSSTMGFSEENKWAQLVEDSGNVLSDIQQMPDHSIPRDLLEKCFAIAVFPSTISAGFGIGGKYGQGVIMVRNGNDGHWSAPAIFNLVGGSIGWQIGGQATDIVLVFMNKRSVDGLLKSKFKLGADAAVSAGPVGRDAEASTDAQLKGGILSYSRSRGLFAGIKLEGSALVLHKDGNKILYGLFFQERRIAVNYQDVTLTLFKLFFGTLYGVG